MSTVYLDGVYTAMEDARISPMDRGFLFGDGIYEVIPSYSGRMVGFGCTTTMRGVGARFIGHEPIVR